MNTQPNQNGVGESRLAVYLINKGAPEEFLSTPISKIFLPAFFWRLACLIEFQPIIASPANGPTSLLLGISVLLSSRD